MRKKDGKRSWVNVNRSPVLTLWGRWWGKFWGVKEQRREMRKVDETRPREEIATVVLLHRAVP